MSQAVILIRDILICPECLKKNAKIKRYEVTPKGAKNLSLHLKMKHDSIYKISIVENSASFELRTEKR